MQLQIQGGTSLLLSDACSRVVCFLLLLGGGMLPGEGAAAARLGGLLVEEGAVMDGDTESF